MDVDIHLQNFRLEWYLDRFVANLLSNTVYRSMEMLKSFHHSSFYKKLANRFYLLIRTNRNVGLMYKMVGATEMKFQFSRVVVSKRLTKIVIELHRIVRKHSKYSRLCCRELNKSTLSDPVIMILELFLNSGPIYHESKTQRCIELFLVFRFLSWNRDYEHTRGLYQDQKLIRSILAV